VDIFASDRHWAALGTAGVISVKSFSSTAGNFKVCG
jgi:hypothetical protein